jgi:hypothetical protein
MITPNLLAWQWTHYPTGHAARRNLLIHAVSMPLFLLGLVTIVAGVATRHPLFAVAGGVLAALALAAQGRGHRGEATPPLPFRSPLDVVARLLVEQLVTFPRFVLSGGFAEAWRRSAPENEEGA